MAVNGNGAEGGKTWGEDTPTVLIADDEPSLRRVLSAVLEQDGYKVIVADGGRDAVRKAKQEGNIDLLVTDFLMPDLNGLEVLEAIRKNNPDVRALLISGHGTIRLAVEAMRLGALDFLTKPFDIEQVRATVKKAIAADPLPVDFVPAPRSPLRRDRATDKLPAVPEGTYGMVGNAAVTRTTRERLILAAQSRATVLLLGESGTGKEISARLIHQAGLRRDKPFVAVSCAALPESLLESELFGHEKSAFTGAQAAKPGRFELADTGTLFLDEIGDIPLITQVKLLRVIQEREVFRIGGVKNMRVDVRIVAATNRDLWQAVQEGTFRADLYYRLNVIPVTIPPLRDRLEDIPELARHFLYLSARENARSFPDFFSVDALRLMQSYPWPGNIRELQNAIEYAVVLSPRHITQIDADALPPFVREGIG